ncbi:MAG TPA: MarR family transcriptional regulator [Acetobacteraceae bacterium]|jgi:DNA-binding MarR family transcriptional regulator|nr:MarR family transcriptional regulator [Acetobacteraceae bacterium]
MASQATAFQIHHAANDEDLVPLLHKTMLSLVKREGTDLTSRQLGVFLTVYLDSGPHTVRGLAAQFNICKPAVTRALDKLGELDFTRRKVDPRDRRSVLVQRTEAGWDFLAELRRAMGQAAAEAEWETATRTVTHAWPRAMPPHRTGFGHSFAANAWAD